jgi:hypothetical protein
MGYGANEKAGTQGGEEEGEPLPRGGDEEHAEHDAARGPKGDGIAGSEGDPRAKESAGQPGDKEQKDASREGPAPVFCF